MSAFLLLENDLPSDLLDIQEFFMLGPDLASCVVSEDLKNISNEY